MLEGKEIDKKLGEYGEVVVDIDDKLKLSVTIGLQVDLIGELEKLAVKSGKDLFVKAVGVLKGLLGA